MNNNIVSKDNKNDNYNIISNSKYTMLIIDCEFLHAQLSNAIIKHISLLIKVRNIKNFYILLSTYTILKLFVNDNLKDILIRGKFQKQIYIVDSL